MDRHMDGPTKEFCLSMLEEIPAIMDKALEMVDMLCKGDHEVVVTLLSMQVYLDLLIGRIGESHRAAPEFLSYVAELRENLREAMAGIVRVVESEDVEP